MNNRELILKKAKELFAVKGFDGTRMDEIAAAASVNKATIYYHFKSKEHLYEAALRSALDAVYAYLEEKLKGSADPEARLKAYVDALYYESAVKDRAFLRMLMREMASEGRHFPLPAIETFLKIVKILDDTLKDGSKRGVFRKVNTKMVHLMVLGSISYLVTSAPVRERVSGKLADLPDFLTPDDRASEELYDIILKGLKL